MLLLKIAVVTNCEFHSNIKNINNNQQQKHETKNLCRLRHCYRYRIFLVNLQAGYIENLAYLNLRDCSLNITLGGILFCTNAVDLIVVSKIFERINV